MKKIIYTILLPACMTACNHTQKMASSSVAMLETEKENTALGLMQQSGTDFFGEGSTPVNWQLKMNYDDTVRFSADDGLSLKVAYNQLKKNHDTEQNIFSGNVSRGNMEIIVVNGTCTIPTHREVYPKNVTVSFNGKSYTGCGKFLADQSLNNKWILDKIANTAIRPEDYNKVPAIQFDLAKQTVSGNDGCNSFGGKIEVQGNRIQFRSLISTKMACLKKNIEYILNAQVNGKLVNYYFKNGELYLYLPDDSLLVFRKA